MTRIKLWEQKKKKVSFHDFVQWAVLHQIYLYYWKKPLLVDYKDRHIKDITIHDSSFDLDTFQQIFDQVSLLYFVRAKSRVFSCSLEESKTNVECCMVKFFSVVVVIAKQSCFFNRRGTFVQVFPFHKVIEWYLCFFTWSSFK